MFLKTTPNFVKIPEDEGMDVHRIKSNGRMKKMSKWEVRYYTKKKFPIYGTTKSATLEEIHSRGLLHESVNIIIYNSKKEILLVLRPKYRLGGGGYENLAAHLTGDGLLLDAQSCVERKLGIKEKLKFEYIGKVRYKIEYNDLIENEISHTLIAEYNGKLNPNPLNVEKIKWIKFGDIKPNSKNMIWINEGIKQVYDKVKEHLNGI
jgi:isopentenyldiphosphate isomerase